MEGEIFSTNRGRSLVDSYYIHKSFQCDHVQCWKLFFIILLCDNLWHFFSDSETLIFWRHIFLRDVLLFLFFFKCELHYFIALLMQTFGGVLFCFANNGNFYDFVSPLIRLRTLRILYSYVRNAIEAICRNFLNLFCTNVKKF
jgi:hypothetical protein